MKERGTPNTIWGTQLSTALRKTPKSLPLVALRVGGHQEVGGKGMSAEVDDGVVQEMMALCEGRRRWWSLGQGAFWQSSLQTNPVCSAVEPAYF